MFVHRVAPEDGFEEIVFGDSWEWIVLGEVVRAFVFEGYIHFEVAEFVGCVSCSKAVGFALD